MSNKIIEYGGKNYLIEKFSAYENIVFDYKQLWNKEFLCRFSCKLDFSGSELIIEKYFLIKEFLNEYENKKWFGFLSVSFKKRNTVYDFLEKNPVPKATFLQEYPNNEGGKLFNGFCSQYINWVANQLNAEKDLKYVVDSANLIFDKIGIKNT